MPLPSPRSRAPRRPGHRVAGYLIPAASTIENRAELCTGYFIRRFCLGRRLRLLSDICRETACVSVRGHYRAVENRDDTGFNVAVGPGDAGAELCVDGKRFLRDADVGRYAANQDFIRVGEVGSTPDQCAAESARSRNDVFDQSVSTRSPRLKRIAHTTIFVAPIGFSLFITIPVYFSSFRARHSGCTERCTRAWASSAPANHL